VFNLSASQFKSKIDTFPLPDVDIRFKYDRAKKIALDFFLHKCRDLNAEKMLTDLNLKLDDLIRAKETINQRAIKAADIEIKILEGERQAQLAAN
jgi:hypothetical protein